MKLYKILLFFLLLFVAVAAEAQAPHKFSYQAVVRNQGNALVVNRQVGLRFTILQGSATGFAVYSETHLAMTNINGLVSVEIGGGTPLFNTIANINWANGPYFLKTETDPNGGFSYTISGTTQMLSVPYALYAENSANPGNPGYNSIVKTEQVFPGTGTCRFGGTMITVGLDVNRNQILDSTEVIRAYTRFVCNGKDGKGIVNTVDNGNGTFTFTYSDATTFTTSVLTGPQGPIGLTGPQGATGPQGPAGQTGATGPQGQIGLTGPQGATGQTGAAGPQGATGPQGPIGATGPQGPIGQTGPQGPIGQTGAAGPQGSIGLTGPQGAAGLQGPAGANGQNTLVKTSTELAGANCSTGGVKLEYGLDVNSNGVLDAGEINASFTKYVCNGAVGSTGPQGATGLTGPQGPIGLTGPQGATGLQGPIGLTGPQGATGPQGIQGPQGTIGATGLTGPQGPIGQTGAQGPIGLTGPQGATGPAGTNGVSITNSFVQADSLYVALSNGQTLNTGYVRGPQGQTGAQGPIGLTGGAGTNGIDGATGPQGPVGLTGPQGATGTAGPQGLAGLDGVSITNSFVQGDSLYVTLSSGQTLNTGYVRGPQGISITNTQIVNDSLMISYSNGQTLNAGFIGINTNSVGSGSLLYWNGTAWVPIPSGTNGAVLTISNGIPTWGAPTLPIVITTPPTKTQRYSSSQINTGGEIISDGGGQIISRGICYSTSPNPTLSNSFIASGNGFGTYNVTIPNLMPHTLYYMRAYVTTNIGTGYGNQYSVSTDSLSLGDFYQGGVVVYLDATLDHGLIGGNRFTTPVFYGCNSTFINGTSLNYGTGLANSQAFSSQCGTASAPANQCLSLVSGGYSDWYLPSRNELELSYQTVNIYINTATNDLWTSSQHPTANTQWTVSLTLGAGSKPKGIAGGLDFLPFRSF